MANYVRESFIWRWRSASCPPRPLPEDFHALCLRFSLSKAEGTTADFELPEIVQVTFYAMLLNEAVELGVTHDFTVESMKSSLVGLRWSTFDVWMGCVNHVLRAARLQRPADEVEVQPRAPSKHYLFLYIMPSSYLSSGDVPEGFAGPQVEALHPQFPSLLAFIDGQVVANIPRRNKCREPKRIPYTVPRFEQGIPSWSNYEYSSTPSILSLEVEVRRMAKTKSTPCIRSPDEPLAKGT
ncbi:hypothetical protein Cgig2_006677 [Carnegiea gigantea]|uniref:Uncharacterized protein n=1 Tax=Carnegiea gigantea TaxID=171969 RepID=A0A9Q1GQS9_9CARY|nr:hypothetical protein Cgig2_006677 [Carnegiea gigantea]